MHAPHALCQIGVGKRVGETQISRSAEGLTGHGGDMRLVKQQSSQFGGARRDAPLGPQSPVQQRLDVGEGIERPCGVGQDTPGMAFNAVVIALRLTSNACRI
jgi:hypothetical protein